jgi:hypothetical protein
MDAAPRPNSAPSWRRLHCRLGASNWEPNSARYAVRSLLDGAELEIMRDKNPVRAIDFEA